MTSRTAILGLLLTLAANLMAGEADRPLLHPLFGSHSVLQRGPATAVWGWSTPGAQVTIGFEGADAPTAAATATAGPDGKWLARIGPLAVGGPWTL